MQPLTPADVQAALDKVTPGVQIQFYDTPTATAQQAADNVGCELGQIVKSLAFFADGQPVLVLVSGDRRVDERKLAAFLDIARKRIKMPDPQQCIEIYGYRPGAVPPLGLRTSGLPVYIDDSLQRYQTVYVSGGAPNALVPIALPELAQAIDGHFADVKREED